MDAVFETAGDVLSALDTVPVDTLPLGDVSQILISFIPVGFALGFLCVLIGLAVTGVMKIFKRAA